MSDERQTGGQGVKQWRVVALRTLHRRISREVTIEKALDIADIPVGIVDSGIWPEVSHDPQSMRQARCKQ
jgi:hypothetical protein